MACKLLRSSCFLTIHRHVSTKAKRSLCEIIPRRKNRFGIPLIDSHLEEKLFGRVAEKTCTVEKELQVKEELKRFGIDLSKLNSDEARPDPTFDLPPLYGRDVSRHFYALGERYIEPYSKLINEFIHCRKKLPSVPSSWVFEPGWTRYDPDNGSASSVPCPLEDIFAFDVEVCIREGQFPVMATALTPKAWYSWCSPYLISKEKTKCVEKGLVQDDLIPLRPKGSLKTPRLVIGHNASYDRARTSEEYNIDPSDTRFLDTMALHIVVNGMTSGQRMLKQKKPENKPDEEFLLENDGEEMSEFELNGTPKWLNETSLNNLSDVYQLYCKKGPLAKQKRDIFIEGSLDDVRVNFQSLMHYCSADVMATFDVFAELFPLFRQRCPHPVTLAGMLEMGSAFLPVNKRNWEHYISQVTDVASELEGEVEGTIAHQAKETCQLLAQDSYKDDVWMWDQNWKCKSLRLKKGKADFKPASEFPGKNEFEKLARKFEGVMATEKLLYKNQPKAPGYPGWFEDLCEKNDSGGVELTDVGLSKSVIPKLLRLSWRGYPLHRDEKEKWGFLVPNDEGEIGVSDEESLFPLKSLHRHLKAKGIHTVSDPPSSTTVEENLVTESPDRSGFQRKSFPEDQEPDEGIVLENIAGCRYFKLPHKDGKHLRVGSPLSKSFLGKVREGVLATESGQLAERVLKAGKMLSYWKSNKDRIFDQLIVQVSPSLSSIIPQLISAGTLTRRAVEKTWLTASNAKVDRVGSELKCMVQAPPGYHLVGADVDSQELWIAAVLGDSQHLGEHGCTAFGWMTLQGTKSEGTDMHSMTARSASVSRDEAKILNYGRIYGAGMTFAKQLLKKFNPTLSDMEANRYAAKIYFETKGDRQYLLNQTGALCRAVQKSCEDETIHSAEEFIDSAVGRRDLVKLYKIKLILDHYFEASGLKNDPPEFKLTDDGLIVARDLNITADILDANDLQDFFRGLRKGIRTSRRELYHDAVKNLSSRPVWSGGSESHTFNRLEEIASDWDARTPVLGCKISRVLERQMVGSDYLPSRINWVVQSSAVDYLHLLLVSMHWLMDTYNIRGRFVISIHDEVRYLVRSEDRYRAALALQISNLLVRAMFSHKLGLRSLPKSVAFFSGVDVDLVMRKEPSNECVTPSNPLGLTHGYGIPLGECLTMEDIVKKTGGKLS